MRTNSDLRVSDRPRCLLSSVCLTEAWWVEGFSCPKPLNWKELERGISLKDGSFGSQGDRDIPQQGLCRGTASGKGDWDTINWVLGASTNLNMSEEAITFVFENWHLTLHMTAQLFGTLIRQSLAAVEVLLIYFWREEEKSSANFWEQIIDCTIHTDVHADAGSKTFNS